jgi:hypothetical protein
MRSKTGRYQVCGKRYWNGDGISSENEVADCRILRPSRLEPQLARRRETGERGEIAHFD